MSSLSISACNNHELTPITAYTDCSIHQVMHTPSIVYTDQCTPWVLHTLGVLHHPKIDSLLHTASLLSLILHLSADLVYSTIYIPSITSKPPDKPSATVLPSSQPTTTKYFSNLDWLSPSSESPNWNAFSLDVHLWVFWIGAIKSISKSTPLLPPTLSLRSLYLQLEVHLQRHSITAFKYIFELGQSWPPSVSLSSHHCRLHGHLHVLSIGDSRWSSKYIWALSAAKFTICIDIARLRYIIGAIL